MNAPVKRGKLRRVHVAGHSRTLPCLFKMRLSWSLFESRWAERFHSIRCTGGALNARRNVEHSSRVPAGFLQCVCQASLPTPGAVTNDVTQEKT